MQVFTQLIKKEDNSIVKQDVFINLYHVSSVEPFGKNDNISVMSLTNGKQFCVEGNYAKIASIISRPSLIK